MTRWSRRLAFGLLSIPIGFLLVFGILELAAGDIVGLGHLLLAVPLIAVALLVARRPVVAGRILTGGGLLVALVYLGLVVDRDAPAALVLLVTAVLMVPVAVGVTLIVTEASTGRRLT